MPENTIVSASNNSLRQLDTATQRQREESSTAASNDLPETNVNTASAPVSVEVDLSREAVNLSLDTSQQVRETEQPAESLNETQVTVTTNTSAQEPNGLELRAPETEPAETREQEDANEAASNERTDNARSVAQQFNPSANEALGTVIDIRS